VTVPLRAGRAAPLPPDERRDAILTAVVPLLLARGAEVTTRELAAAAGVAEGTLFRVFSDKRAIIRAAIERALDPQPLLEALATIDPRAGLRPALAEAVTLLQAGARDVVALVVLAHRLRADHADPRRDLRPDSHGHHGPGERRGPDDRLAAGLVRLLEPYADRLRRSPEDCAHVVIALVFATVRPIVAGRSVPLTPTEIVDIALDGLLAADAPASDAGP